MLISSSIACLLANLGDKGLFSTENILQKYSPPSCLLAVLDMFLAREDKGDREGIPHTHPIP